MGQRTSAVSAVERNAVVEGERANLLQRLWRAGTPYIHWRMPWIGYEYWDPERPEEERFLAAEIQAELIGQAVGWFAKVFSTLPRSACAPGYRANDDTHRAWAQHGIRVAQNGPGGFVPPHFDRHNILNLCRTVEFEPATDPAFSIEACLQLAESCFARGIPAIISLHSINFHSTVRDFRSRTLQLLDEFLAALEARHADLLYLHDEDLRELVEHGSFNSGRASRAGQFSAGSNESERDPQELHKGWSTAANRRLNGKTEIDCAGNGGLSAGRSCRLYGLRPPHHSLSGFARGREFCYPRGHCRGRSNVLLVARDSGFALSAGVGPRCTWAWSGRTDACVGSETGWLRHGGIRSRKSVSLRPLRIPAGIRHISRFSTRGK